MVCLARLSALPRLIAVGLRFQTYRAVSSTPALFAERRYTKKHEWISVEGKIGTVGITSYAQGLLGDIVYAELPEKDTELSAGDAAGAIESVKAASDVYSPASGIVTEKNAEVETTPALINKSCYEKGWLFKLNLKEPSELDGLMGEEAYEAFVKDEEEANH